MARLGLDIEWAVLDARGVGLRAVFADALPCSFLAAAQASRTLVALLDLVQWQSWLPDAWGILDADERLRVERRRQAAARDELVLGYALHRLLLSAALGCPSSEVPLTRDARGCPRLRERALWTSLTHADGAIGVAISAAGPVGIDMERASRAASMAGIAERVCHPVDAAALAGLLPPAWNTSLLQLWVRKEALLKAAGVGMEREMHSFPAYEDGEFPLAPPDNEKTRLATLDAGPGWVAAVAAPPGSPVDFAWLAPVSPSPA